MTTGLWTRLRQDRRAAMLAGLASVQGLCALYFITDVIHDIRTGTGEDLDRFHMTLETIATLAMGAGTVLMAKELRRLLSRLDTLDRGMRTARGEVAAVVDAAFRQWGLTPSERDVAVLLLKGLGNREIAELRGTAQGTVRAQTAAIYGKAGLKGRTDLFAYFMEDLLAGL